MEPADILLKKIANESDLQKPINVLICFANPKTAKALMILAGELIRQNPEKSAVTALHLMDKEEAKKIENFEVYKSELFADFLALGEKTKAQVRTFVKTSENFVDDILITAEEQQSNLILAGIGENVFNTLQWERYKSLKSNPDTTETDICQHFGKVQARSLHNISSLLSRNPRTTGILSDKGMRDIERVFVPILDPDDVHVFTYIYLVAQKENVKVMIWDAMGLVETHPSVKKLYQFINRKTDGKVYVWDNEKKIDISFIHQQDLVIMGINGWEKLIDSAISWTTSLPSTLIIKEKTVS